MGVLSLGGHPLGTLKRGQLALVLVWLLISCFSVISLKQVESYVIQSTSLLPTVFGIHFIGAIILALLMYSSHKHLLLHPPALTSSQQFAVAVTGVTKLIITTCTLYGLQRLGLLRTILWMTMDYTYCAIPILAAHWGARSLSNPRKIATCLLIAGLTGLLVTSSSGQGFINQRLSTQLNDSSSSTSPLSIDPIVPESTRRLAEVKEAAAGNDSPLELLRNRAQAGILGAQSLPHQPDVSSQPSHTPVLTSSNQVSVRSGASLVPSTPSSTLSSATSSPSPSPSASASLSSSSSSSDALAQLLMLLCVVLRLGEASFKRELVMDTGSAAQLNLFSTLAASAAACPSLLLQLFSSSTPSVSSSSVPLATELAVATYVPSIVMTCLLGALSLIVFPVYCEGALSDILFAASGGSLALPNDSKKSSGLASPSTSSPSSLILSEASCSAIVAASGSDISSEGLPSIFSSSSFTSSSSNSSSLMVPPNLRPRSLVVAALFISSVSAPILFSLLLTLLLGFASPTALPDSSLLSPSQTSVSVALALTAIVTAFGYALLIGKGDSLTHILEVSPSFPPSSPHPQSTSSSIQNQHHLPSIAATGRIGVSSAGCVLPLLNPTTALKSQLFTTAFLASTSSPHPTYGNRGIHNSSIEDARHVSYGNGILGGASDIVSFPNHEHALNKDRQDRASNSCGATLLRIYRHIRSDRNSTRIFVFLSINFIFMFVELIVGALTNSLGLISDAGHMLFDCTALAIGLYASYVAKLQRNSIYTYGYARVETLSGFVNGVFLLFIGLFVFVEGVQRLFEEPEIRSDSLILVSVLGFCVNMIGLVFFHDHAHGGQGCDHGHSHGSSHSHNHNHSHSHGGSPSHEHGHGEGEHDDHGHSHGDAKVNVGNNHNMEGIFLHVLADALGSVGVIISSILIHFFGWTIADAICSILISLLIVASVVPLLKNSALLLLQHVPDNVNQALGKVLERLPNESSGNASQTTPSSTIVGVRDPVFWVLSDGKLVGSVHVMTSNKADDAALLGTITSTLRRCGLGDVDLTVQCEGLAFARAAGLDETCYSEHEQVTRIPLTSTPLSNNPTQLYPQHQHSYQPQHTHVPPVQHYSHDVSRQEAKTTQYIMNGQQYPSPYTASSQKSQDPSRAFPSFPSSSGVVSMSPMYSHPATSAAPTYKASHSLPPPTPQIANPLSSVSIPTSLLPQSLTQYSAPTFPTPHMPGSTLLQSPSPPSTAVVLPPHPTRVLNGVATSSTTSSSTTSLPPSKPFPDNSLNAPISSSHPSSVYPGITSVEPSSAGTYYNGVQGAGDSHQRQSIRSSDPSSASLSIEPHNSIPFSRTKGA